MKQSLLLPLLILSFISSRAGRITGKATNEKGEVLPYASVFVKGSTKGTTTNNQGVYFLELDPGNYTLVCQYVGYARSEKAVTAATAPVTLDFTLSIQQTTMNEVIVRANAEDPAYEIIRNAIRKRKDYLAPLDSFTCEAYIKTLMKTRKLPKRVFGQKIDEDGKKDMGVDSAGKGVIFLSESLTRIAYRKPGRIKLEVLSGRESGSSGYGFNFPTFINFYNNNVNVFTEKLNPRGFVSPIADGAMNYYKYKYLGSYWEEGKEINQIKVIPRRNYEPLFSGTINITEGDWRIHSLELTLTKQSQLELLDTMVIRQIHVPVTKDIWQTKDQVVYFTFNQFGIDATGTFLNVYNKYELTPQFKRNYFNNVIVRYDTSVNKKSMAYWDSIRPVALEPEEIKDYRIKDSLYAYRKDSVWSQAYTDSVRRKESKITVGNILWTRGLRYYNYNQQRPVELSWMPLLRQVQYNTVEGLVIGGGVTYKRWWPKAGSVLSFTPQVRYGFSNTHLNAWGTLQYAKKKFERDGTGITAENSSWTLSGGKRVSQFNQANPIWPLFNSIYTLVDRRNYMKIYENYFGELTYNKRFDNDLRLTAGVLYEDRLPIENTTDFSIFKDKDKIFTPNYPYEKIAGQFIRHRAVVANIQLQYRPGQQFIEFPNGKFAIGSKYPLLTLSYHKGIDKVMGSDVDFDKWKFSVSDDVNFKLRGLLKYRVSVGGFFNDRKVPIQDYQHFNGNQLIFASDYLNSFQLAPYYQNSTTASFYTTAHLEHHFNGLLTNKIPLFKKLNWHLVGGGNAFYVDRDNNYVEVFAGLENIFKVLRVDIVGSYLNGNKGQVGLRLGLGGLLGSSLRFK
ncbi:MAG: carboxypeptidase-like regulatory domain-containing protein [Chitinophagaceae bacterium]|nr:carboxypeptidase-like regulatory domain-containing protein [Chitinophagaceae bacterium]